MPSEQPVEPLNNANNTESSDSEDSPSEGDLVLVDAALVVPIEEFMRCLEEAFRRTEPTNTDRNNAWN